MLRTTLSNTARPLYSQSLRVVATNRTAFANCGTHHTRLFSSSSPQQEALSKPSTSEQAGRGTEGAHIRDGVKGHDALSSPGGVGTVPAHKIQGDWVLFHPVYTPEELKAVEVLHRDAKTFSDKVAARFISILRWGFDKASGYKHKDIPPNSNMTLEELRKGGYAMDEQAWLNRILFLETIAGIPGMVAATIRHLTSMRLMRRDSGWIHTLLEEAENERMHLMTFMTLRQPSIFFRALVLGAQGVYYNIFFLMYLVSPKLCHRAVGLLEEEAVVTYTRCIEEVEAGRLPSWSNTPAPEIAKDYWRLDKNASLLDVIYAVRSDESNHRFVNHSLANLNQKTDINPFALRDPSMDVKGRKVEFTRDEAEEYVQESHRLIQQGMKEAESKQT